MKDTLDPLTILTDMTFTTGNLLKQNQLPKKEQVMAALADYIFQQPLHKSMISSLKKVFLPADDFKAYQMRISQDSQIKEEKMEVTRQIKQAAQKTQDLETILAQIESDIKQIQYDIRKTATYDELRCLDKKVDGLPTFASITTLDDKFTEYQQRLPFEEWQTATNTRVSLITHQQDKTVTQDKMTEILATLKVKIDGNYENCSKAKDCGEDRQELKFLLKQNAIDDAARKTDID